MKTIHKYNGLQPGQNNIFTHVGASFLTAQMQRSSICIWAEVDTEAPEDSKQIFVLGTGLPIHENLSLLYIGTVIDVDFVWHVYEFLGFIKP